MSDYPYSVILKLAKNSCRKVKRSTLSFSVSRVVIPSPEPTDCGGCGKDNMTLFRDRVHIEVHLFPRARGSVCSPDAGRRVRIPSVFQYEEFGEEASMVMQLTVNQPPLGTTGSIPVFSTKFDVDSTETYWAYKGFAIWGTVYVN